MSQDQTQNHFERLLQNELDVSEREDIITRLEQNPEGQRMLAAWQWIDAAVELEPETDLRASILDRLPTVGSPRIFAQLGESVIEGWTDLGYRARLREEPRRALAERGLILPEQLDIEIVPPAEARLPRGNRVFLPLPELGQPAVSAATARRQLGETDFAWLLGPPWATTPSTEPAAAAAQPSSASQLRPWLERVQRLFAPQPMAALLGAILILAAGLQLSIPADGLGTDLSGAAGAIGPMRWIPIVEMVVGLGLLAYAIGFRRS